LIATGLHVISGPCAYAGELITISDDEVLEIVVPDHKSKAEEAAARPEDSAYSPYRILVAERLETDFGISRKHYVLVAVQEAQGYCGGCYPTHFAIIDVDSRTLVWSYSSIGLHAFSSLRTFALSKGGATDVFAFQYAEGSHGCCASVRENWYRGRFVRGGLDCSPIWSGLVRWENGGNRGGTQERGCGRMAPEPNGLGFLYKTVVAFAEGAPCDDSSETLESACAKSPFGLCSGAVELTSTERWETTDAELRRTQRGVARRDRASSKVFPFRLRVRIPGDYLSAPSPRVESRTLAVSEVVSLNGKYRIESVRNGISQPEIRLVQREEGKTLRVIPLSDGDMFAGELLAVGWMRDSSRFLAVVRFGYAEHKVLLSFGVSGSDDLWEKLLADDAEQYDDGFLVTARLRKSNRPHR
jgi:hypothetical protein